MVKSMNTGDYCSEGRELYSTWLSWYKYKSHGGSQLVQTERAIREAWRLWQEHRDNCEQCKKGVE